MKKSLSLFHSFLATFMCLYIPVCIADPHLALKPTHSNVPLREPAKKSEPPILRRRRLCEDWTVLSWNSLGWHHMPVCRASHEGLEFGDSGGKRWEQQIVNQMYNLWLNSLLLKCMLCLLYLQMPSQMMARFLYILTKIA